MFESEVIEHVCRFLEDRGFRIEQKLSESERGDDIVAARSKPTPLKLFVEAKGATSSRPDSNRYGKPFSRSQVRDHIAMALYKAAEIATRENERNDVAVGIALPGNKDHLELASNVWKAMQQLDLAVFWVDESGTVSLVGRELH